MVQGPECTQVEAKPIQSFHSFIPVLFVCLFVFWFDLKNICCCWCTRHERVSLSILAKSLVDTSSSLPQQLLMYANPNSVFVMLWVESSRWGGWQRFIAQGWVCMFISGSLRTLHTEWRSMAMTQCDTHTHSEREKESTKLWKYT